MCVSVFVPHGVYTMPTPNTLSFIELTNLYPQSDNGGNGRSGSVKALVRHRQPKAGYSQVCSEQFNTTTIL